MQKSVISLSVIVCMALSAWGQTALAEAPPLHFGSEDGNYSLAFSLQYRPRFEYNDGKDFAECTKHEFISHRARLGLKATYQDSAEVFFQVQDVRTWGEESNTLGDYDADHFDLHQGYLTLKHKEKCLLRIGRQEIAFDGHRIVGTVNWTQQARSFDAVNASYRWENGGMNAVYAKLREGDVAGDREDVDLFMFHGSVNPTKALYASLLVVHDYSDVMNSHRWTVGPYATFKAGGFNCRAEGYGQFGDVGTYDYSSFMGSVRAGYTFDAAWAPTLDAWFDYLSGDDDPTDDKMEAFDTLYATNHKFYGYMDFFLNIPVHTAGLGLIDPGVMVKFKPHENVTCILDYHHFLVAEETPGGETDLGDEVDLTIKVPCPKGVTFTGGFSIFSSGEAMKELRGDEESTELFGFIMADLSI